MRLADSDLGVSFNAGSADEVLGWAVTNPVGGLRPPTAVLSALTTVASRQTDVQLTSPWRLCLCVDLLKSTPESPSMQAFVYRGDGHDPPTLSMLHKIDTVVERPSCGSE